VRTPAGGASAKEAELVSTAWTDAASFALADAAPVDTRPKANAKTIPAEATVRVLRILFSPPGDL
jgi:hypothetical protein